jgi:ABC-type nitrate/sulfonate/bicarbonate transport system substrate-binding protein
MPAMGWILRDRVAAAYAVSREKSAVRFLLFLRSLKARQPAYFVDRRLEFEKRPMDRRNFLRRLSAGVAGVKLAGSPLAAWAAETVPDLGRIGYQLDWIKNFQFVGSYVADHRGYFRRFGLSVDLLNGGPGAPVDPVVVAGVALVGQSSPDQMGTAVMQGAPITCIGANYQRPPFSIISLASKPILSPHDLAGRKLGIQMHSLITWKAFLKLNKIDPATMNVVPVQADPTPLVSGEVDGIFGYATDQVVELRTAGYDPHYFLFADYGYKMFSATYSVLTASLADRKKRAQLVAFMKGEVLGWQDAIADPDFAAKLDVEVYGKGNGLDFKSERQSCIATNDLMVSDDTRKHGLFWMSPESIEGTLKTLEASGVKISPDRFTN